MLKGHQLWIGTEYLEELEALLPITFLMEIFVHEKKNKNVETKKKKCVMNC